MRKKCIVSELGEMAMEAVNSDREFVAGCACSADLLHAITKWPELLEIVNKMMQEAES